MRRVRPRLRLRARTRVKVEVECGVWSVEGKGSVGGGGEGGPHRVWCGIIAWLRAAQVAGIVGPDIVSHTHTHTLRITWRWRA